VADGEFDTPKRAFSNPPQGSWPKDGSKAY
jgi:hypothetical protein